jgi:serine/threonine protein kinase
VALKLIAPAVADDPHFRERFERESRLAASIDHPNVLPTNEQIAAELFLTVEKRARLVERAFAAGFISERDL